MPLATKNPSKFRYSINLGEPYGVTTKSDKSLFTPADISNMIAWYDSSDITTIIKNINNRVSQWSDKSSNQRHFVENNVINQPTWVDNGKNSLAVLTFGGIAQMTSSWTSIDQPITIVSALKHPASGTTYSFAWDGRLANKRSVYARDITVSPDAHVIYGGGSTAIGPNSETIANLWGDIFALYNGSSSKVEINNLASITGDIGTHASEGLLLNRYVHGGLAGFINFGEIIIYNKILTASEENNLKSYLRSKWGL